MEEIIIKASRRTIVGKQVNALRRQGQLPAVLYGRHVQAIPLSLDLKEASRTLQGLPASALIVLQVDDEQHFALVREKQRNPLLGTLRHVDFQAVSLTEKVRSEVPVHLVGESPAVKNFGGILVTNVESLLVESLPRDLPERINVDISGLAEIGDAVYVRDLSLPGEVNVHAEPDDVIVVITAPVSEAEYAAEEGLAVEEPEVIEKGRGEEEEEEE
jgi:large subunit ribosomal protein L25